MSDLTRRTATELADALASGETSSAELTRAHLDRIGSVDGDIHAFLHVDAEGALAAARASDERRASGTPASALDGVPVAVKDVLVTRGLPTTCGSRSSARSRPRTARSCTGRCAPPTASTPRSAIR